ncbi:hypothetical protein QS257_06700 [Terrilactibacillus sp. S3-3]|nr:hypothetical protein QS257_06700 [Terrilactibacillus sp. S3-3]
MLILSKDDILQAITMTEAMGAIEEAYIAEKKKVRYAAAHAAIGQWREYVVINALLFGEPFCHQISNCFSAKFKKRSPGYTRHRAAQ